MCSMCCLKLFCIHSVNTHIEPHVLISHVSEDDGLFTRELMVSPLVVKGIKERIKVTQISCKCVKAMGSIV